MDDLPPDELIAVEDDAQLASNGFLVGDEADEVSEDTTECDEAEVWLKERQSICLADFDGDRRLCVAVLEDAFDILRKLAGTRPSRRAEFKFAEVWDWLTSNDRQETYAFLNICDVLGYNPEWLRTGIGARVQALGGRPKTVDVPERPRRGRWDPESWEAQT